MKKIDAFTDGACLGNPGPGGWGVILRFQNTEKELSGNVESTTNNRMELVAAIKALKAINEKSEVTIHTDSKYVMEGITNWIKKWKNNGWRTSSNKPVANIDLWNQLDEALNEHSVSWAWIRGHTGHPYNDRADSLARGAAQNIKE